MREPSPKVKCLAYSFQVTTLAREIPEIALCYKHLFGWERNLFQG